MLVGNSWDEVFEIVGLGIRYYGLPLEASQQAVGRGIRGQSTALPGLFCFSSGSSASGFEACFRSSRF